MDLNVATGLLWKYFRRAIFLCSSALDFITFLIHIVPLRKLQFLVQNYRWEFAWCLECKQFYGFAFLSIK